MSARDDYATAASGNGLHIRDDRYEEIRLYVKNNGEYFLYCRGGSKSEWFNL